MSSSTGCWQPSCPSASSCLRGSARRCSTPSPSGCRQRPGSVAFGIVGVRRWRLQWRPLERSLLTSTCRVGASDTPLPGEAGYAAVGVGQGRLHRDPNTRLGPTFRVTTPSSSALVTETITALVPVFCDRRRPTVTSYTLSVLASVGILVVGLGLELEMCGVPGCDVELAAVGPCHRPGGIQQASSSGSGSCRCRAVAMALSSSLKVTRRLHW